MINQGFRIWVCLQCFGDPGILRATARALNMGLNFLVWDSRFGKGSLFPDGLDARHEQLPLDPILVELIGPSIRGRNLDRSGHKAQGSRSRMADAHGPSSRRFEADIWYGV
jgi:hypothetical protein